ncbi:MAG: hypothetical protein J0L78_09430 [Planctomycetes bacterium]|nr:hypothetical protein [Planctomycetota bacterium]
MRLRCVASACMVAGIAVGQVWGAPLAIKFKNSSGLADSQVYIGFVGGEPLHATNAANGAALAESTHASPHWYTLAQLAQGINLTSCTGRIYIGYGTPWVFERDGYEPSPVSTNDPNYLKRYDKIELSYHGVPSDVANLTSIDYYSIKTGIKVFKGGLTGALVGQLRDAPTQVVLNAVRGLTSPASAAVVNNGVNFVRVLGPGIYPPTGGNPASHYNNLSAYLSYLHATYAPAHGNKIATIAGNFIGVGAQTSPETKAQSYNFAATMNASMDITLTGSGSVVGSKTIVIKGSELLSPTGIYGANPAFTINGGGVIHAQNDFYGWVVGDLLSGLNIGAVGSTVVVSGAQVGQMNSQQWFTLTSKFNALQPTQPSFYNQWARAMSGISDAYNFAYSDRFAHVFVPLDPAKVDTMQIEIGGEVSVCPANLNGDEVVDGADFAIFASAYDLMLCDDPEMTPGCPADLSGDGMVDDGDFAAFAAGYRAGACPE